MYDYNYTAAVEMGYDAAMANRWSLGGDSNHTINCYSRDFNLTQYQSTVVTEVRLQLLCAVQTLIKGFFMSFYSCCCIVLHEDKVT